MERDELRNKYTEELTVENTKLVEKNNSLTEANSKLFMQIGVESSGDGKPEVKKPMDLRKLGI